jgi:glycosyltransferase involved in cell wall biosynthesis
MALNVCMISGSYPPMKDGVGDYTQKLFEALRAQLGDGISLITTETEISRDGRDSGIWGIVPRWNCRAIGIIIRTLRKMKPDLVHIQYPAHGYGKRPAVNFLPLILRLLFPRVRVVSTMHEFANRSLLGKLRLLISIIFSHKVIIVDKQYARAIKRFWPFAGRKLVHIPVGANILPLSDVDKRQLLQLRTSLHIRGADLVICYFGVIRRGKGLTLLLESFSEVMRQHPNSKLLLIGHISDQEYYKEVIEPAIEHHGLGEQVVLTGSCEPADLSRYLALSDICVLPFEDGVTTKRGSFMVALQHGLPIITTRSEFLPDGLVEGENVILVDYGNKQALVAKMLNALENYQLRSKLGRNAAILARTFCWDIIASRTHDTYLEVFG